jgi:hypothetical protein
MCPNTTADDDAAAATTSTHTGIKGNLRVISSGLTPPSHLQPLMSPHPLQHLQDSYLALFEEAQRFQWSEEEAFEGAAAYADVC